MKRFAIWGWVCDENLKVFFSGVFHLLMFFSILKSYGGYLSAMALFNENTPFKCAVSGAPVADWLFYGNKLFEHNLKFKYFLNKFKILDSAYTERYMGSYSKNRQAYEVISKFSKITYFLLFIKLKHLIRRLI